VKVVTDSGKKLVSTRVELREVFLESAMLLVELGRLPVAIALVAEAQRHCIAFDDMFGLSMCRRVTSRVAELQGNHDVALKAEYMAETLNGDAVVWVDSVDFVVKSLGRKHRKDNLSYQNMKALQLGVVEKALGVFRAILDHPDKRSMRIEVQRNTGLLLQLKAQELLQHAHETALDGQPDKDQFDVVTLAYQPALELLIEAVSIFETMEDVVNQIAGLRQCAQVRLAYCLATHSPVHTPDLLSLTPTVKSNVHLDFAIELLTRAKRLSETRLQDVRPADIRRDIQLPVAHLHAEVCMELSQGMLLVHN
jgi:hypothetical protein